MERIIIRLVPAYTLELLDQSDIERILPYYFYDYRLHLRQAAGTDKTASANGTDDIVIRNGKKYRRITADRAKWADSIF